MPDAVPAPVTPDEERGYREGVFATRLDQHDKHFERLNGSMEDTVKALAGIDKALDRLVDQVTGLVLVVPKIQTVAEQALVAEQQAVAVAAALAAKTEAERTNWERWRVVTAWGLGVLIALITLLNFGLRLAGI